MAATVADGAAAATAAGQQEMGRLERFEIVELLLGLVTDVDGALADWRGL
jgi:hypothetical protein